METVSYLKCATGFVFVMLAISFAPAREQSPLKGVHMVVDIYEQFMERFSDGNAAWKTEIVLGADVNRPPDLPRKLHYEDHLGYYTYRVKRWDELSEYEKFAVQNDPRFPHFVREQAARIRQANARPPEQSTSTVNAGTKTAPNSASDTAEPRGQVPAQLRGVLIREGTFSLAYKFDPSELLKPQPLRLMETPEE